MSAGREREGDHVKPEGPVARRGDYEIEPVPHALGALLVREHHYAKGCSNTSVFCHGIRRVSDGEIVGAILWLPPTQPAARSIAGDDWRSVLGLSRVVVAPGEPKNTTGLFLARSIREVSKDTRWRWALTYADEREGHTGTIYKATGWEYLGKVKGDPKWIDENGRQVARRSTFSRTSAEMIAAGCVRLPPVPKHKFRKALR